MLKICIFYTSRTGRKKRRRRRARTSPPVPGKKKRRRRQRRISIPSNVLSFRGDLLGGRVGGNPFPCSKTSISCGTVRNFAGEISDSPIRNAHFWGGGRGGTHSQVQKQAFRVGLSEISPRKFRTVPYEMLTFGGGEGGDMGDPMGLHSLVQNQPLCVRDCLMHERPSPCMIYERYYGHTCI